MKIRNDFVTNSSSSSFILGFKKDDDIETLVRHMIENYETDKDVVESFTKFLVHRLSIEPQLTAEEIIIQNKDEVLGDSWFELYKYYSKLTNSKEAIAHLETPEGRAEVEKYGKDDLEAFANKINSYGADYFIQVELSDDGYAADLESYIMPKCELTVVCFNHH